MLSSCWDDGDDDACLARIVGHSHVSGRVKDMQSPCCTRNDFKSCRGGSLKTRPQDAAWSFMLITMTDDVRADGADDNESQKCLHLWSEVEKRHYKVLMTQMIFRA